MCCLLDQRSLTIFSSSFLPFQPNEAGFVLLGDLTLDSSTDPDDGYQMVRCSHRIRRLGTPNRLFSCFQGPPSPCDVEFENAYIVPEGKSSIRTRTKEVKVSSVFTRPPCGKTNSFPPACASEIIFQQHGILLFVFNFFLRLL